MIRVFPWKNKYILLYLRFTRGGGRKFKLNFFNFCVLSFLLIKRFSELIFKVVKTILIFFLLFFFQTNLNQLRHRISNASQGHNLCLHNLTNKNCTQGESKKSVISVVQGNLSYISFFDRFLENRGEGYPRRSRKKIRKTFFFSKPKV